jgi:hypothetical protein
MTFGERDRMDQESSRRTRRPAAPTAHSRASDVELALAAVMVGVVVILTALIVPNIR